MSSTINVYQSLNQKQKVINYSPQPELVYSRITTLSLLLRQVENEGVGIIFCHHPSSVKILRCYSGKEKPVVTALNKLYIDIKSSNAKVLIVGLDAAETVKISDLHAIARTIKLSGIELKWISILEQPGFNQLFKWELKYN